MKAPFGMSWEIASDNIKEVLYNGTREENLEATEAMRKMDNAELELACHNK